MSIVGELREQVDDLDRRIDALVNDAKPIREQIGNIDRHLNTLRAERGEIAKRLAEMSEKPRISDHAVIRYLERKYGFDFEAIRAEMLTDPVRRAIDAGAEGVKFNGGVFKIKGRTVTTYMERA